MRNRYREKFGLTAKEMDEETLEEIRAHWEIWNIDEKRQKRENNRREQESQLRNG